MVQLSASTILANYQVEATGIPGPPGEDGKTSYFHVAYANSADGSLDFSTTESAGRSYIGTYTDFEILDSNDPTKYKWQKVEGPAGEDGQQGEQGEQGPAGDTTYFYQAWANSSDGTIGFSITESTGKGYLGTYSSTNDIQSTNPADYKWTELVGSIVIDATNYALESRFNWRPYTTDNANNRSYVDIPLSQTLPSGTRIQASVDYYWLSGNKPSVDGIRVQMLTKDGTAGAGVETNLTTAPDTGQVVLSGRLTADAGYIRIYNGASGKDSKLNRYQSENIVVNIGDRLCPWRANVRDTIQRNNLLTNSTWQLGGGNWQYNVNEWDILSADVDKPTSNIAQSKVTASTTKQMYQNPHPVRVKAEQIIVVSFDYKESGEVPMFFTVRSFASVDTPNSEANAQEVFSAKRSEIGTAYNGWSRVTMRFVTTKAGFLDFLPYNNTTDKTNAFREIMVTTNGSLQGDYAWYQPDYTSQSVQEATQTIPRVYVQSLSPTGMKDGDQWWKMSNNEVTNFYVWGNGQWNEQTIEQSVLNITTLNAVNINGSIISGSEFLNSWEIDTPATEANPYPSKDIGFTKLADGKLTQENTHSMMMVDDYIDTNKQTTTLEKGVLINRAQGWSPSGDFGFNREARYDNAGLEFTDYSEVGTPVSTVRLLPTEGLWVSNVLEGGTAGVLPTGPYYNPSAINHTSGDTPFVVTYGTGGSFQNDTTAIRRISFGGNPSYGWGSDPNNSPIEVVYPTNNYLFRITRKCKLYIQYGLRVQGNGASNGADYVYSGFSWGTTPDSTNTDANSHVIMWGADTGDTSMNLQHATMAAGYYAFSAGTYLAVVRSIRSGRTLMNCTGQFIRFEEMYN